MAQEDYRAKIREIISEVKKTYSEYYLRENEAQNHLETKLVLERLSQSAEARYATGQIPYHEVLRAHTELATITNEVAKHYQQRDTALARLNSLWGREDADPLEITVAIADRTFSYTKEDLMKRALENRPELRAMRYGVEAASTDSKRAWLDLLPDGQVRIEARQFSGEGSIREYDTFLGLSVPVWSLVKGLGGEWKGADKDVQAAEASYGEMKNEVLLAIHEADAKVQTALRGLTAYEQVILPQAKQQVEVALSAYEAGRADLLSLIDAQRMLRDAQIAYYKFVADYEVGLADLRLAVGGPLVTSDQ